MRIITLNCWGGRAMHPLMRFFRYRKQDADVFCLQEVFDADQAALDARHPDEHLRGDMCRRISGELAGWHGAFGRFEGQPDRMGLAIFHRPGMRLLRSDARLVHVPEAPKEEGSEVISSRMLLSHVYEDGGREVMVSDFHGLWFAGPKTDTPERLMQSRRIVETLAGHPGPKVLVGDFNLLPDTASVRMLKTEAGLRDLVTEYGIPSTRTPLYRHYANPDEPNFADYVMTSPELPVKRFEALPDLASDHCPLLVEFD